RALEPLDQRLQIGALVQRRQDDRQLQAHRVAQSLASTASPIATVPWLPPRSPPRKPSASALATAPSIRAASASSPKLWRSSMAAERIVAIGLATPLPAMSGALPWIGS